MVIQMTREQYEATYGTPVPSVGSVQTQAPQKNRVQMTRQQYQQKYGQLPTQPQQSSIEQQKQERIAQGLPVSVRAGRVEPTGVGTAIRAIPRALGSAVASVKTLGQNIDAITTGRDENLQDPGKPVFTKSNYLGDIYPLGYSKEVTQPGDFRSLGIAAQQGLDIASVIPGGSVVQAGKTLGQQTLSQGLRSAGTQFLKTQAPRLATEGGLYGGSYGLATGIAEGATPGETIKKTALGTLGGAVTAPAIGGLGSVGGKSFSKLLPKPQQVVKKEIVDATTKALGIQGKRSLGRAVGRPEKMAQGLAVIQKYAPVDVKSESIFDDSINSLVKAKDEVFNTYNAIAQEAGEKGATIDLDPLEATLKKYVSGITTAPKRQRALRILSELRSNFPEGKANPVQMQEYIKLLNEELGGVTGGAERGALSVVSQFAKEARQATDDAIGRLGKEYDSFKQEYSALKEVEDSLVREYQKVLRRKGSGLSEYADMIANSEMLGAIITANPGLMAKGIALRLGSKFIKSLNNPETWLKKAYQGIDENPGMFTTTGRQRTPQLALPAPALGAPMRARTGQVEIRRAQAPQINLPEVPTSVREAEEIARIQNQRSRSLNMSQQNLATNTPIATANSTPKNPILPKVPHKLGKVNTEKTRLQEAIEILKDKNKRQAGFVEAYKETGDLTTKILKDLEGRTTVSKQYILDATNRGDIKQVEKDLIRDIVSREGDTVSVADFAKKVKAELLPLKVESKKFAKKGADGMYTSGDSRWESVVLKDERGNVANYKEHIYESPIKTSAGEGHFPGKAPNYFGHTRIEDMADNKTRRVIEVQSDLYQKGNLERETQQATGIPRGNELYEKLNNIPENAKLAKEYNTATQQRKKEIEALLEKQPLKLSPTRQQRVDELRRLEKYNDPTAHFRMIREEIKKASQDGKTKLQFPTGETAMKIEGLGNNNQFWNTANRGADMVRPEQLEVGKQLYTTGDSWIITDVLGDGKFKAVQKDMGDFRYDGDKMVMQGFDEAGGEIDEIIPDNMKETFDISGKVDTNNPIYKFYEKDVAKYLNKFGGKRVVDDKGVSWIEIPITKEQGKAPVEAFGKIQGGFLGKVAGASAAGAAGYAGIQALRNRDK